MTQTEEKRLAAIMAKYPELPADRAEFLVRSGLTFNEEGYRKFLEQRNNDVDWYYPKGSAFNDDDDSSDADELTDDSSDADEPTPDTNNDNTGADDSSDDSSDDTDDNNIADTADNGNDNNGDDSSDDDNTDVEP